MSCDCSNQLKSGGILKLTHLQRTNSDKHNSTSNMLDGRRECYADIMKGNSVMQ
jgi:hypothetical protein